MSDELTTFPTKHLYGVDVAKGRDFSVGIMRANDFTEMGRTFSETMRLAQKGFKRFAEAVAQKLGPAAHILAKHLEAVLEFRLEILEGMYGTGRKQDRRKNRRVQRARRSRLRRAIVAAGDSVPDWLERGTA